MSKIYSGFTSLIGNTPLIHLENTEKTEGLYARLLAKAEYFCPAGSVKDRVAAYMVAQGEKSGQITRNTVIIEPTSGNTGIGLAAVAACRGYRAVIVMPENMSAERIKTMRAYGAEVVLTPAEQGMAGAIKKAEEIKSSVSGGFIAGQFTSSANVLAHYETTAPELYRDTDGCIDIFVAGIGTGGTITGVGKYLKEKNSEIKIIGVEPALSPVLTAGKGGAHGIQGIGAGFVPEILDMSVVDEVLTVTEEQAYQSARALCRTEGLFTGISSGAALHVAKTLAKKPENKGKTVAVLLPDGGGKYLSTPLYEC